MKEKIGFLLPLLLSIFVLIPGAQAATLKAGEDVIISSQQVVNDNFYLVGGSTTIDGTINGDLVTTGGYVTINGTINGDLIVAGGMITISGKITDSAMIAGGNIDLRGEVESDALAFGGNFNLGKDGRVKKDLIIGAGNARLAGDIGRDVKGGGGNIQMLGEVGRNVKIQAETLSLLPGAAIKGNLTYTSPKKADIQKGTQVEGEIVHKLAERPRQLARPFASLLGRVIWFVFSLLATLLIGILIVAILPQAASRVAETMIATPWLSLGLGFALLILTPIAAGIIAITLVGFPLSLIILAVYFILLYISKIFVGIVVGKSIFRFLIKEGKVHLIWSLLLGLALVALVGAIPFLGFFARLAYILFGLGALAIALSQAYRSIKA